MALTIEQARQELAAAGIQYTRADYMNGTVGHQTYYGQFATDTVIGIVLRGIGKKAIDESTDEHMNDIPLRKFDALALSVPSRLISLSNMFTQAHESAVPFVSLSDQVCILKAAARKIKG